MSEIKWQRKYSDIGRYFYYESEAGYISVFHLSRVWYAYPRGKGATCRRCDTWREAKEYCEMAWRAR